MSSTTSSISTMSSTMERVNMLVGSGIILDNAEQFDGALALVNMARQGTNEPEMTPQQGLHCLHQTHTEKSVAKPTADNRRELDRLQVIIDSVYLKYVKYPTFFQQDSTKTPLFKKQSVPPPTLPRRVKALKRSAAKAELDTDTIGPVRKTNVRPSITRRTETVRPVRNEAQPTTTANTDKPKKTKAKKGDGKGRSSIEHYGLALNSIIKKHDKDAINQGENFEQFPDFSVSFSDPKESVIVKKVFTKKGATAGAEEKKKYEGIKRRCLFAAALLYEGNLLRMQRGKSEDDNKPFDVNTTRMQPAALVDVNSIRPIFRAYRPDDDTTFKAKEDSRGRDPDEAIKGLLAKRGWFPKMVEKSANGYKLINTDWYEKLGTKQERQKWLAIVEEKKAQLIKEAPAEKEDGKKKAQPIKEAEVMKAEVADKKEPKTEATGEKEPWDWTKA